MSLNSNPVGIRDFTERPETGPPKSLSLAFPLERQSSAVHVSLSSIINLSKNPTPENDLVSVENKPHILFSN